MDSKSYVWKIAALMLVIVLLAGCRGAQPALEPTVDTAPTFAAIATQAVQTAVANMTLNAPTAAPAVIEPTAAPVEPTAAPTEAVPTEAPTELPTLIPTIVIPSATPVPTLVPTVYIPPATATSSAFNCTVTESSPEFGWDVPPGGDFDGRWVVKNTGSTNWSGGTIDVVYVSGTKFQTKVDALDIDAAVAKGKTMTAVVDMLAPKTEGRYSATWAVKRGKETLCNLFITIDVVKN